jgi:hypothetical protein
MKLLLFFLISAFPLLAMAQADTLQVQAGDTTAVLDELTPSDNLLVDQNITVANSSQISEDLGGAVVGSDTLVTTPQAVAADLSDTTLVMNEEQSLAATDTLTATPAESTALVAEEVTASDSLSTNAADSLSTQQEIAPEVTSTTAEAATEAGSVSEAKVVINPQVDTIQWTYGRIENKTRAEKITLSGYFISYGLKGMVWVQTGMERKYSFDIKTAKGDWLNTDETGELLFEATCEGLNGTIRIVKEKKEITILLDFSQPDILSPNVAIEVNSFSKI